MSQKLTIKAFFFNAKTDYLPYYKHFNIRVEDDATAKELLALIQEADISDCVIGFNVAGSAPNRHTNQSPSSPGY